MLSLPALTSDITVSITSGAKLTESVRRPIEPVGKEFMHHATRTLRNHTWSEFEKIQAEQNVQKVDESNVDPDELLFDTELADETLLAHDARDWKTADLYAAMGLSKLRYNATENQIIKAHRKQVVKYHPDKQSASGAGLDQDGFFKIIQKAFESYIFNLCPISEIYIHLFETVAFQSLFHMLSVHIPLAGLKEVREQVLPAEPCTSL